MADKTILITIDDEGITVEGQGFEGSGYVAEVSKVMKKMGITGKLEKKPEYHQHRPSALKQEIKQNS
jgi:hypothetical protein